MAAPQPSIGLRDPLSELIAAVLGTTLDPSALVDTLGMRRLSCLARLLHYRIATAVDAERARRCRQRLEQLSDVSLDRLLRAPALCQVLRLDPSIAALETLLDVELDAQHGAARQAWSALGDVWLGDDAPVDACAAALRDGRYRSPVLACGLPIDLSLPVAFPRPSAGLRSARLLDRAETRDAIARCDRAVELLHAVYPLGYAALCELKSNVVLRAEDARASECWGATSSLAIGRLVLVNPAAAPGREFLAEHLLHELTHAALACAELENPLLRQSEASAQASVPSPWTGNLLTAHTFLHACAVWAVLLELWSRYRAGCDDSAAAAARQAFIVRGFEQLDARASLAPYESELTPSAERLLSRVDALRQPLTLSRAAFG